MRALSRAVAGLTGAGLLALALSVTVAVPATAAPHNSAPHTGAPGSLTGYGFDSCAAPPQAVMDAWWESSPYSAVGIYLGGSAPTATRVARLDVGDRYGLARDGDELHILGPVTFDPKRIVARVPLTGADVELVGDRLVVHGGPTARGMVIAFASLSVSRRIDLAAALGPPTDELAR